MKSKPINLLIIALTIHIFSVHCKLLYYLNPELDIKPAFTFISFNEPTILAMVFALAYSLATFFVVSSSNRKTLIFIFAFLDSIGVLLYYFTKIPLYLGAIYFALYTGILIISTVYLDNPEYLSDQIFEMKQRGVSQREIAVRLKISESSVSRILKRVNNADIENVIIK
ncbi:MAG: helix-turn-helix domain-containing protein [Bacteroidetes bacterium]|nr:helix-turn-helix domain-containing protein [Bacteroidota bacterium]